MRGAAHGTVAATGLAVAAAALLADQVSKQWLLAWIQRDGPQRVRVTPFLDLVLTWNQGISYGLFQATGGGQRLLVILTIAVLGFFLAWLLRTPRWMLAVALGLVVGGGGGNLADRLLYGAVADFLSFHVAGFYWYIFNVADICISMGAALMVWDMFRTRERGGPEPSPDGSGS